MAPPSSTTNGRAANGQFGPGNPGRPPGARNRASHRVVAAILEHFEADPKRILGTILFSHPNAYVSLLARLLPTPAEFAEAEDPGESDPGPP